MVLKVTMTLPVVAPAGTGTTMLVSLQLLGVAIVPLNATVPVWTGPKFFPEIVTSVPTAPDVGLRAVMLGTNVKSIELLFCPLTTTMTLPVAVPLGTGTTIDVELQVVGVANTKPIGALNSTELDPCVGPKFVPLIITDVPTTPDAGFKLVMLGGKTVKVSALLATPPTVSTTGPVVALFGAGTKILVPLQLVGVATTPLNVTVLVP